MVEKKYIHKGFWIEKKDGKHYMISYNFMPLGKRKQILEISKEEYEKYRRMVI